MTPAASPATATASVPTPSPAPSGLEIHDLDRSIGEGHRQCRAGKAPLGCRRSAPRPIPRSRYWFQIRHHQEKSRANGHHRLACVLAAILPGSGAHHSTSSPLKVARAFPQHPSDPGLRTSAFRSFSLPPPSQNCMKSPCPLWS